MVYIVDRDGHPLMPTMRHGKVRRLLNNNKAKVIKRCPFTIQLLYKTGSNIQPITLGVDAGSKKIGMSATTESTEYFASEVEVRNDIVKNLSKRREFRRARRNRKTRHRKARFDNRRRPKGWLAPSVEAKVESHLKVIADTHRILPIISINIETASFDIQKIKNPDIQGEEYQQGEQLGFWNVREYVLARDGHTCQCCHGKSGDPILNVHHIESRQTGGDTPNNLITLCETCHNRYHQGEIKLPESIHRGMSFRDAAFMGIMRWACYDRLKEIYPDVHMTFGYITKNMRIKNHLEKSHIVDARCISGHTLAKPAKEQYFMKKVRCHNRQIHKFTIQKSGVRKRNQAPYIIKGFRLNDVVKAQNKYWFIHGRRLKGSFVLSDLSADKLEISPSKISFVAVSTKYITERRKALLPAFYKAGYPR